MPHALVLTTASKAATTGGTFADTLTANSGDSLAVSNYVNGGARHSIGTWLSGGDPFFTGHCDAGATAG